LAVQIEDGDVARDIHQSAALHPSYPGGSHFGPGGTSKPRQRRRSRR
jgi:hypothetical protein